MNWWKSILLLGLASVQSYALTYTEGAKHTIVIESLGLWSHVNHQLEDKSGILVASYRAGKVAKVSVETGSAQWTFDTDVYFPDSVIVGIYTVLEKNLAVVSLHDGTRVALSIENGYPVDNFVSDSNINACPIDQGCQIIPEQVGQVILNPSGITVYNDGRVIGPSDSWNRDEAFGSVINSTLRVDYRSNAVGDEEDEICTDPTTLIEIQSLIKSPLLFESIGLGAIQPITKINDHEKACVNNDLIVLSAAPDRLSLICHLPDSHGVVLKESWSLFGKMCPSGAQLEQGNALLWRLSSNEYSIEYLCDGGSRFLNTVTLNSSGSVSVGQPKALEISQELLSNGQSLYIVDRKANTDSGVSLEKVADYSKLVKHALQTDETTKSRIYIVKDSSIEETLLISGYRYDEAEGSTGDGVEESWNVKFPHTVLVQKIENIERKRAMAAAVRFPHPSLVTKNDGVTIERFPMDILTLSVVKDTIDSRLKIIGINSFTGELVATYSLPDTVKVDAKIFAYRSNNQILIQYRSYVNAELSGAKGQNAVDLIQQVDVIEMVSDTKHDPWNLLLASFGFGSSNSKNVFAGLPFDLSNPQLMARTYIVPFEIENMTLSQSDLGITPKNIFINTTGDNIHALPSFLLNARRPRAEPNAKLEPGQTEDGLSLYHPLVMSGDRLPLMKPFHSMSAKYQGKPCHEFISFPVVGHESASMFIASSNGLFGMAIVHPAGKFDSLPESQSVHVEVALSIFMLIILIIAATVYNRYSTNKKKWL